MTLMTLKHATYAMFLMVALMTLMMLKHIMYVRFIMISNRRPNVMVNQYPGGEKNQ